MLGGLPSEPVKPAARASGDHRSGACGYSHYEREYDKDDRLDKRDCGQRLPLKSFNAGDPPHIDETEGALQDVHRHQRQCKMPDAL